MLAVLFFILLVLLTQRLFVDFADAGLVDRLDKLHFQQHHLFGNDPLIDKPANVLQQRLFFDFNPGLFHYQRQRSFAPLFVAQPNYRCFADCRVGAEQVFQFQG